MTNDSRFSSSTPLAKFAAVSLGFWMAKIAATTLGETGGDWVTMSLKLGYLAGTGIFAGLFVALVWVKCIRRDLGQPCTGPRSSQRRRSAQRGQTFSMKQDVGVGVRTALPDGLRMAFVARLGWGALWSAQACAMSTRGSPASARMALRM